jgi:hypothetical protein
MKPEVSNRVHKSPPLVPVFSQMHPIHTTPTYFPKIHSNIILPSRPTASKWSLSVRFPNENSECIPHLSHECNMSRLPHPPLFEYPNNILWRVQVIKFIMQSSPASRHFLPLRSKYSPQYPDHKPCQVQPLTTLKCLGIRRPKLPQPHIQRATKNIFPVEEDKVGRKVMVTNLL